MREHFNLEPGLVFLNHGSFGACPKQVFQVRQSLLLEVERDPVDFFSRRFAAKLYQARRSLARYLEASADDLVFVDNATVGVNIVTQSIALASGDEVLACDHEYGACQAAWEAQCHRSGASYRKFVIDLPFSDDAAVAALEAALSPKTRVVFLSHVTSPTALVLPIKRMIEAAHRHGAMVVIDGAHAPALIDLAIDDLNADFYTGNCHKWMCAPKSAGFLHVRADHHDLVRSPIISWGHYDFGDIDPSPLQDLTGCSTIERQLQWLGTRDLSAALSVPAAIEFMQQHDWQVRRKACRLLAREFGDRLAARLGTKPLQPLAHLQMIAVALPACDASRIADALYRRHRIELPVMVHAGRQFARVSVQAYNARSELELLLEVLPGLVDEARTDQ